MPQYHPFRCLGIARSLAEIDGSWREVARRRYQRGGDGPSAYWSWCGTLGTTEAVERDRLRDSGVIGTVQGRAPGDEIVLYARRPRQSAGGPVKAVDKRSRPPATPDQTTRLEKPKTTNSTQKSE